MRSTFKLTLAAIAVSFVITGCKSSHGPSVVAKNSEPQPIQITKEKDKKEESNKANNIPAKPAKPEQPAQPDIPKNKPYASGINEDSKGQAWRVVALSRNGSLLNISEYRKDHLDSLTKKNSPLGNSEEFGETEYNHFLSFELGQNEQGSPFIKNLNQKGNNYLGQHSGIYQDSKIVGDSNKINYLYVNQPYSSYGALFTDANNSNLFHVQLSTGRDGGRIISEGESGASYAEYGVYTLNGQTAKWNDGLVGDAVYQGNVIARIEKQIDDESVVFAPQVDGDVTLNLHLDNNWTDSKLSGKVNSTTIGEIKLEESKLAPATYLADHIGFNGEAKANNSLEGFYSVEFAGPKLNDAVGSIELENETDDINNNDITKYNAVFGAVKTEK